MNIILLGAPLSVEITKIPETGWSSETLITLGVSIIALLVSSIALFWQVHTWRASGPKVRVSANVGFTWGPAGDFLLLCFEVSNSGRAETEISAVNFKRRDGGTVMFFPDAFLSGSVPFSLKPGQKESLILPMTKVVHLFGAEGIDPDEISPRAESGHGETVGECTKSLKERLRTELESINSD